MDWYETITIKTQTKMQNISVEGIMVTKSRFHAKDDKS